MVDVGSPFFRLYQALLKSMGPDQQFHVELDAKAQKLLRKMGPEGQNRVKKIISKVHGTSLTEPNPHVTRMDEPQHVQVGLDPSKRNGYTLGDYRVRMMGVLNGNKMTVFHVGTREESKHTGRTAR